MPVTRRHVRRRRPCLAPVVAACVVAASAMAADPSAPDAPLQRGRQLFSGDVPLRARLAGHDDELPALASRCMNCHETVDRSPDVGAVPTLEAAPGTYAPVLNGEWLSKPRARRGGPDSAFDEGSLCGLLRTGIDPASIIISTTMPRYEISDAQCADLWAYLHGR